MLQASQRFQQRHRRNLPTKQWVDRKNDSPPETSKPRAQGNRKRISGGLFLKVLVRSVNKQLLEAELPQWFKDGPTDASAREAAKFAPGKQFRDWSNISGSALLLAMLQPECFGITFAPSISQAFISDRDWHLELLTFISPNKQASSRGINNRRTNIIEGLLNHFADLPAYSKLHGDLHRAWQLMSRALWLTDPELKLDHREQVAQALLVKEHIEDDAWWTDVEQRLTDEAAELTRKAAKENVSEQDVSERRHKYQEGEMTCANDLQAGHPSMEVPTHVSLDGAYMRSALHLPQDTLCMRLPEIVAHATQQLMATELPQWFLEGPTVSRAEQAARSGVDVDIPGWTNAIGSALILAMLEPARYGVSGPSLFDVLDTENRDWYLERWTVISDSKNGGRNASRSNLLKSLLKHLCTGSDREVAFVVLWRSLELMIRVFEVIDPYSEFGHEEQVQKAFACNEAIQDDTAWLERKEQLQNDWKQGWRLESNLWISEECDRLFTLILPRLRSFAEQRKPGEPVTGVTYSLMRSWIPGEGFSSKKKGASALLKRLWAKAEAQLNEWDTARVSQ